MSGPLTTLRSDGVRPDKESAPSRTLAAGTEVGRYVLLGVAGSGSFGTVYRAYDPELDRSVALKRFHEPIEKDRDANRWALSEARALAKLRHPNIVTIYDVGEHQGHVFVAMEFVQGSNLQDWLEEQKRSWEAIAAVMLGAARGLGAAHDAGIIHRDFKPQNVLVTEDGVGYVADFGLAVGNEPSAGQPVVAAEAIPVGSNSEFAARPLGTPEYLAPELYDGVDATIRSDLFSFCVTLWEAAFGERPWTDGPEAEMVTAKRAGPPPLPRTGVVPRPVAKLLRAGLSPDPALRPAAFSEVVTALAGQSGQGRRWLVAAGLLAGSAAVGVLSSTDAPCSDAAAAIDSVWNDDVRDRIAAGAAASSHGGEAWQRAHTNIDDWATRWTRERQDACEATHVRHEQSEALLDVRGQCFDRELRTLRTLLEVLEDGGPKVLSAAPRASAKLAARQDCSLAATGSGSMPSSVTEPKLQPLLDDLDRVAVLETLALYDEGLVLARDLESRAAAGDAVELVLQAQYRRARLLEATGDAPGAVALHTAVHWEAVANGFDSLAASAGIDAMYEYAAPLGQPEVALTWAPHVSAVLRRAGDNPRRRANLIDNRGIALLYTHDLEAAREAHETALELRESYDNDGLDTVATLQNLGIVYEELHRYAEAIAQHQRAHTILQRLLGDRHPHVARVRDNLGTAQLRAGDFAAATENFQFALDVRRSVLGPQHRSVALSVMHLAHAALAQEEWPKAIDLFEEALALLPKSVPPKARNVLLCHEGLAHAHHGAGQTDDAKKHAQLALDGLAPSLPEGHPELEALRSILHDTAP